MLHFFLIDLGIYELNSIFIASLAFFCYFSMMKQKLHILHIPKWYPNPKDPQLGVFIKKQIQAASPYDTHSVLYIKSNNDLDENYNVEVKQNGNVLELYIFYKRPESRTKQFFLITKLYEKGFKKITKLISKPDILHVHNLITPAVWTYKYSRDNAIPWVLSEHWSGYTSQTGIFASKMMWERKLWQWYSDKAECTIAVSSFLKKALIQNKIGKNHHVIPNVVEMSSENLERSDKEIRILNVSDMVDSIKNISGILHAFVNVSLKYPNLRLHLVGGGPDEKMLKDLSKELGISAKVKFFGSLANEMVLPMYNQVDFVLINSKVETFSVVAAEALLAGKPVLTTRCGGVEEFINENNGLLFKANDNKELEKAMDKMILNYHNYDPETLQKYAKEKFSTEAIGKSLSTIYHTIVS